jgi:hypothetical protein
MKVVTYPPLVLPPVRPPRSWSTVPVLKYSVGFYMKISQRSCSRPSALLCSREDLGNLRSVNGTGQASKESGVGPVVQLLGARDDGADTQVGLRGRRSASRGQEGDQCGRNEGRVLHFDRWKIDWL